MSISVDRLAGRILRKYDHDGSGAVDLKTAGSGNLRRDETLRLEQGEGQTEVEIYGRFGAATVSKDAYTRSALLRAADANGDRLVTRDELTARIAKFDADGDGKLCRAERDRFDQEFGERLYLKNVRIPARFVIEFSNYQ